MKITKTFLCGLLVSGTLQAATVTWINTDGGLWTEAANWSPNQVPGPTDTAVITEPGEYTVEVRGTIVVGGLTLGTETEHPTVRIVGDGSQARFSVTADFENQGVVLLDAESGTPTSSLAVGNGAGLLTNREGGVVRTLEGSGGSRSIQANVLNEGQFDIQSVDTSLSRPMVQAGQVNIAEGSTLRTSTFTVQAGATLAGEGLLDPSTLILETDLTLGSVEVDIPNVSGTGTLINPAGHELTLNGVTLSAPFENHGTLTIVDIVGLNGPVTNGPDAIIRILATEAVHQSQLRLQQDFENAGLIEFQSEREDSGTLRISVGSGGGTLTNLETGTIRIAADVLGDPSVDATFINEGLLDVRANAYANRAMTHAGELSIDTGVTFRTISTLSLLRGGILTGEGMLDPATLVLETDLTLGSVEVDIPNVSGTGTLINPAGHELTLHGVTLSAPFQNDGDLTILDIVALNGPLANGPDATIRILTTEAMYQSQLRIQQDFENAGLIEFQSEREDSGTLRISVGSGGGTLTNLETGTIRIAAEIPGTLALDATVENRGTFELLSDLSLRRKFTNSGLLSIGNGASLDSSFWLENPSGGVLTGNGNLVVTQFTNRGSIAPGASAGLLSLTGDYPEDATATLEIEILGPAPDGHDRFEITGKATLQGTLNATLPGEFRPVLNDLFQVLGFGSREGTFAMVNPPLTNLFGWATDYSDTGVSLRVVNTAPYFEPVADLVVDEETTLNTVIGAIDSDEPAQQLSYLLLEGPENAAVDAATGALTWSPTEADGPGTFPVAIWVVDDGSPALGATAAFNIVVNEVNRAPMLVLPSGAGGDELTPLTWTITATDPDLPANPLTLELLSAPEGVSFDPETGEISWTPGEADGPGEYPISLTVTDENPDAVNETSLSDTEAFPVLVSEVNTPPTLVVPNVNPQDELSAVAFTVTSTDGDLPAQGLTYELVAGPEGAVLNPATGKFTWTPAESDGPASHAVEIRVRDDFTPGMEDTASFTIEVVEVNEPPTLVVPADAVVDEESAQKWTIEATDSDEPANPVTLELVAGPEGLTFDPATGEINWTPSEAQGPGTFTVKLKATDENTAAAEPTLSTTASFEIVVQERNLVPELVMPADTRGDELEPLSWTITARDPDLPPNTLTMGLFSAPDGVSFDPETGELTWTPGEADGPGTFWIRLWVADENPDAVDEETWEEVSEFKVTVAEVNTPPTLAVPPLEAQQELEEMAFTVTSTDDDLPAQGLTYELVAGPAGAMLDPTTGEFTWTPGESDGPGSHAVEIRVRDDFESGMEDTASFDIEVAEVNAAPTLLPLAAQYGHSGAWLAFSAAAEDADEPGNTLTFEVISAPGGLEIDPTSGTITWDLLAITPGTSATVEVQVHDDGDPQMSDTLSVDLHVADALRIDAITTTPDTVVLRWDAVPSGRYQVQTIPVLGGAEWADVGTEVTGEGFSGEHAVSLEPGQPFGAYRVLLVPSGRE